MEIVWYSDIIRIPALCFSSTHHWLTAIVRDKVHGNAPLLVLRGNGRCGCLESIPLDGVVRLVIVLHISNQFGTAIKERSAQATNKVHVVDSQFVWPVVYDMALVDGCIRSATP